MARSEFRPGTDPVPIMRSGAARGVGLATEYVLGEARKLVPHERGDLERSGRATVEESSSGGVTGAVSFDTPYAVVQHERTDYRHKKGRRAKYLETPLNASKNRVNEIIAAAIKGAL